MNQETHNTLQRAAQQVLPILEQEFAEQMECAFGLPQNIARI